MIKKFTAFFALLIVAAACLAPVPSAHAASTFDAGQLFTGSNLTGSSIKATFSNVGACNYSGYTRNYYASSGSWDNITHSVYASGQNGCNYMIIHYKDGTVLNVYNAVNGYVNVSKPFNSITWCRR